MSRALIGWVGAAIGVAMFIAGLILTPFGVMMAHPSSPHFGLGLFYLVPGILLLACGVFVVRKALRF